MVFAKAWQISPYSSMFSMTGANISPKMVHFSFQLLHSELVWKYRLTRMRSLYRKLVARSITRRENVRFIFEEIPVGNKSDRRNKVFLSDSYRIYQQLQMEFQEVMPFIDRNNEIAKKIIHKYY